MMKTKGDGKMSSTQKKGYLPAKQTDKKSSPGNLVGSQSKIIAHFSLLIIHLAPPPPRNSKLTLFHDALWGEKALCADMSLISQVLAILFDSSNIKPESIYHGSQTLSNTVSKAPTGIFQSKIGLNQYRTAAKSYTCYLLPVCVFYAAQAVILVFGLNSLSAVRLFPLRCFLGFF
jgi:hypothetical protein